MSDLELRQSERQALGGDPQADARRIIGAIRSGKIPREHVVWASHLGDVTARMIEPKPRIVIDCLNCQRRRDQRRRRNRDSRRPTPVRETPRQCTRCYGTETSVLEKGLIYFVQQVETVPHKLLIAWAVDCVDRQIDVLAPAPALHGNRYLLPHEALRAQHELPSLILPAAHQWLVDGNVGTILLQRAGTTTSVGRDLGVLGSLATAVARADVKGEERTVRYRVAEIASACYHAAKGTRKERTWQEECLISYLLGY